MKREYKDYVKDVVDAFEKIYKFSNGIESFEDFEKDEKTVFAIIKLLENIGEAVKKIPEDVRNKYPEVPWQVMAGMRDILVHEYFGIDCEVVWRTIKEDIPSVKPLFHKIWTDS